MKRKLGLLVFCWVFACGPGGDSPKGEEAASQAAAPQAAPTDATTPPAPAAETAGDGKKLVAQPAAAAAEPGEDLRGDSAKGKELYGLYCSSCHGLEGKGDGPMAMSLVPPPRDHTDTAYMGSLSDEDLFTVIQKGGAAVGKSPLMAPWGAVVSEEQTRDLISYLRVLSGT